MSDKSVKPRHRDMAEALLMGYLRAHAHRVVSDMLIDRTLPGVPVMIWPLTEQEIEAVAETLAEYGWPEEDKP